MWLDRDAYFGETVDDRNGSCVHFDGSLKLAGLFFTDFAYMVNDLAVEGWKEGELTTDQGVLQVNPTAEVKPGESYFILSRDGAERRGLARQSHVAQGFEAAADRDCDVWFFADEAGLKRIKTGKACTLSLKLAKKPETVTLFDPLTGCREALCPKENNGALEIEILPWQTYYWIVLE